MSNNLKSASEKFQNIAYLYFQAYTNANPTKPIPRIDYQRGWFTINGEKYRFWQVEEMTENLINRKPANKQKEVKQKEVKQNKSFIEEKTELLDNLGTLAGDMARLGFALSQALNRLETVIMQAEAQFRAGDTHATFNKQTIEKIKSSDLF